MAVRIGPNAQQRDAHTILKQMFAGFGLTQASLSDWALAQIIAGTSMEQLLLELELRPEYEAAFPEIQARKEAAAKTGVQLEPLSPATILAYRTEARALMHSFGTPAGLYQQNEDFFDLIVGDVSLAELQSRLELVETRVRAAPPEVRAAFAQIYGSGYAADEALFTAFLDADNALPRLEELVAASEVHGAGQRYGFDVFESTDAASAGEYLRRVRDYGMSYDQLGEGFSELDRVRSLFDETLYETDWAWQDQGVGAAFGLEGGAAEALERRGESRAAESRGRSRAGEAEGGVIGLGTAGRI